MNIRAADVHAWAQTDGFQAFKGANILSGLLSLRIGHNVLHIFRETSLGIADARSSQLP
jgi:hypothetical protein